jgi:membrane-bound metal-dependent hydrolase YbcI (DUF457 family)
MDKQGIEPWTLHIHHYGHMTTERYMPVFGPFRKWFLLMWCQNRILKVCNIAQKLFLSRLLPADLNIMTENKMKY